MDAVSLDLTTVVQPVAEVAGLVVAGLLAAAAQRFVGVLQARFGIELTKHQQDTVHQVAQSVADVAKAQIERGALSIEHVDVANPKIRALAQVALSMAPQTVQQLGVTEEGMAHMLVARIAAGEFRIGLTDLAAKGSVNAPAPAPAPAPARIPVLTVAETPHAAASGA